MRPPSGRARQITRRGRRRLIPLWVKWSAALALTALVFRKVIAFAVVATLSAGLHLIGLNLHLPDVKLTWPWQSVTAGVTTDTDVGPWVLQKIEGISRPASRVGDVQLRLHAQGLEEHRLLAVLVFEHVCRGRAGFGNG